jgi:transmembrane sensor
VERAWSAAGALAHDPEVLALGRRTRSRRTTGSAAPGWGWAAPATAALAIALAALLAWSLRAPVYESGVGEQRIVQLDDGSVMRLNTDSRAVVRLGGKGRRIRLTRGQALFEVAHDPARPFVVDADGTQVRALGTRFDVRLAGERIDVVLLQGSVEVASADATVTLKPHQRVTVAGHAIQPVSSADVPKLTSWTEGRLVFEATPLAAAVAEVNRYARRKVKLADPAMGGAAVSGTFRTGDAEAFAAAVASVFELDVDQDRGEAIVLRRPGPPRG